MFVAHCKQELGDMIPEDARATKKVYWAVTWCLVHHARTTRDRCHGNRVPQATLELEPAGQLEVSVGFERVAVDSNTGEQCWRHFYIGVVVSSQRGRG